MFNVTSAALMVKINPYPYLSYSGPKKYLDTFEHFCIPLYYF